MDPEAILEIEESCLRMIYEVSSGLKALLAVLFWHRLRCPWASRTDRRVVGGKHLDGGHRSSPWRIQAVSALRREQVGIQSSPGQN